MRLAHLLHTHQYMARASRNAEGLWIIMGLAMIYFLPWMVNILLRRRGNAIKQSDRRSVESVSKKKNAPLVIAEFWGLTARVGKSPITVRVILKRVGNGRFHFWSVMAEKKQQTPLS